MTKGTTASFFIDGAKVGEIKGQPPAGGSLVGLFRQLPTKGPSGTVQVDSFQVKN